MHKMSRNNALFRDRWTPSCDSAADSHGNDMSDSATGDLANAGATAVQRGLP
eukprot:COSAG02_NODE_7954_length_2773_cov_2.257292_2_plen_52_part_00